MDKLNELVKQLARARNREAAGKDFCHRLEVELYNSDTYMNAKTELVRAVFDVDHLTDQIKTLAIQSNEAKPHPAVDICMETKAELIDAAAARVWAEASAPVYLQLDQKGILDYAKKVADMPLKLTFVRVWKEPQAVIKQDLSGYLEAQNETA